VGAFNKATQFGKAKGFILRINMPPFTKDYGVKKTILLVTLGASMGGVESYVEGLSGMLQERANVLSFCVLPELAQRLRDKGTRVFRIPAFRRFKALRFLIALCVVPVIIIRERVDVVLCNGFLDSMLLFIVRLLGRKAVYTQHGPFEHHLYKWYREPARYFPRLIARLFVNSATHVICVSEATGRVIRQVVPIERVSVIPNSVSRIPPHRPLPNPSGRATQLLYAGRLERYKGLYLLLEAVQGIPQVSLTVLGDGSYRKELERLAAGMNVRFEGFQANPDRYYEQADIFVMPSLGPEGLPMVSIEAMAHGVPCLLSDLEVHREITGGGTAGTLFRSGDADDLKRKLLTLIESADLRTACSAAAYQRVKEVYNRDIALGSYLRVFGLVATRPADQGLSVPVAIS
jgi:glycosyltransferase involved in cell wall biosynthesis